MSRFVHNRALLSILVVLLQVSFLPDQGRVQCMLRSGLLSCCCGHDDGAESSERQAEPEPTDDCCTHQESASGDRKPNDGLDQAPYGGSGDETCSCGSGAVPPPVTPAFGDDQHKGKKKAFGLRPSIDSDLRGLVASKRVSLRALPRARTGPPLRVLYQVFLI